MASSNAPICERHPIGPDGPPFVVFLICITLPMIPFSTGRPPRCMCGDCSKVSMLLLYTGPIVWSRDHASLTGRFFLIFLSPFLPLSS